MSTALLIDPRSSRSRRTGEEPLNVAVFETALGWMALAVRRRSLVRLVFGYQNAEAAREALRIAANAESDDENDAGTASPTWLAALTDRLVGYAAGEADDFADIPVWSDGWTPFQRRVLEACRQIPFGQTQTYAELAKAAGRPGAARAVGRTMATNPIPLVIPCHRVVGSRGALCGFSAEGGIPTKRRLLDLERRATV